MDRFFTITLSHVYKSFVQTKKTKEVIKDASLSFMQGKTYALVGVSGSGKSTLLHLIAGIDQPTSGSVFIGDVDSSQLSFIERALAVGVVFQQPYLLEELSVKENIMLAARIVGIKYDEGLSRAEFFIQEVGLDEYSNASVGELSGGQRQRVALARALVVHPPFLVADELTGNLDEQTGKAIFELLCACQKKWNMGLILSTHNEVLAACMDEVWRLHEGVVVHL